MSRRSQNKLVVDLRCGVHRDDASDRLLVELRRKPLAEWSSADALAYAEQLVCQRDEAFEFVVPLLLRCDSRSADSLVLRHASRVRTVVGDVEAELDRRWRPAFAADSDEGVLRELQLTHRLLGPLKFEALLDEWSSYGRSFGGFAEKAFGSFWTSNRPFVRDWSRDRLERLFSR